MAIQTETVVLRVEGQTDGAVRETRRLALAQRLLQREVQATSKAMAEVPATKTAGLISKLGDGLRAAGIDAKGFNQGLRDIGKGLTFDLIRRGLKGLGTELDGVAGSALSAGANGAAMGAAFGGPFGAAIGGAAGALVGLITHTDRQTEASKRAAKAAREHAAAIQMVADGETKARLTRREARRAVELAEEELNQARLNATAAGLSQESVDVRRAQRDLRAAQDQLEALNRDDGVIWLEQRKRERERLELKRAVEAATRSGIITEQEAKIRLGEKVEVDKKEIEVTEKKTAAIKKQTEARFANVQAALAAQGATRRTDTAGAPIGFSTSFGASADSILRDEFGRDAERGVLDDIEARRTSELAEDLQRRLSEFREQRVSLLQSAFGPIEEFDVYRQGFETLGGVFNSFGDAVGAAYEAIVTGQGGVSAAFKKVFADGLMAIGKSSVVEAIRETALGFGKLALGPLGGPSAAMHFKSAAMHGAVAVAAGIAANAIGTSAAASVSTPAPAAGASAGGDSGRGPGGGSGNGGQAINHYTIVVGEHFYSESNRMRQLDARRFVEEAVGSSFVEHS